MSETALHSDPVCSVIESEDAFLALEDEWNRLVDDADCTVFQSFEWIHCWWKYFGERERLHLLCFRREGRLVGIAPMCRATVKILGIPVGAKLQFIGHHLADYGDVIARRGFEENVVRATLAYLADNSRQWDFCDFEDVNETSHVRRFLSDVSDGSVFALSTYQGSVCPQRSLPPTWDEFVQSLGPNLRSNLKRKQKKLEEQFATDIEVFTAETEDLDGAVESFASIHGERWKGLGFPSAFDDPHHRAFHAELAHRFARRGWLRLSFITVNGNRVAVSFDFLFRRRIYMYQCNAAGPDDVMKYSPGTLIKAITIRAGITQGMTMYDFLRGDEPYKLAEWKSFNSKNYLLRLVNLRTHRSMRMRLFVARELLEKSAGRVRREYYELRKFTVTQQPSFEGQINFVFGRIRELFGLGAAYIRRNLGPGSDGASQEPGDLIAGSSGGHTLGTQD